MQPEVVQSPQVHSLALLQSPPDHHSVMVVAQGYMLELCGIVLCATVSSAAGSRRRSDGPTVEETSPGADGKGTKEMWPAKHLDSPGYQVLSRRWLIRGALLCAAVLSFATTAAEGWFSAGPLYGAVLIAQSAAFNFLLVYTCEKFPTSSRASAVGLVLFFGEVARFFMPALGIVLLRHMSQFTVVSIFNSLYLVAFVLTFQLPLPSFREKPLHDIDESRGKDALKRKRLGVTYQTV
ncbi:Aurora kinase B-A [Durusdinium trenchii]|uniref:Aurora kinase B-A n=1 Tax=Durusdinium trenchii TaxID=1381693 RepID=A0ABP0S405_9DINO